VNTETYDREMSDALARWWWPGQWLRIVWSVWVDQKWYWENVYPRLENRRREWGIFVQTWLGAMLIALCLQLIGFLIAGSLGMEAVQDEFTLARLLGLVGILALLSFGMNLLWGAVEEVPFSAVYIIAIAVYVLCDVFLVDIEGSWPVYFVLCLMLGLAVGIFRTVQGGYMERNEVFVGAFLIFVILDGIDVPAAPDWFLSLLSKFALAFILGSAGIYAGARWATRDLTEEMAERLKVRKKR